jgi:hypothetical protein
VWVKRVWFRVRRADGSQVSIDLWHRATAIVRERYRTSAPALYGAGLDTDEDDRAAGVPGLDVPTIGALEIGVPAPRRAPGSAAPAVGGRTPQPLTAASR